MVVVGCWVTGIPFMASAPRGPHSAWSHLQKSQVLGNGETVWCEFFIRRGAYMNLINTHNFLSTLIIVTVIWSLAFEISAWFVICEVEPNKGPRRIWEIEHDLLSTDLGRNRVGEDVRGNMSTFIKYILFHAVREHFRKATLLSRSQRW